MSTLLHYLLESGACLLVFYLLYALVLRREKCFTYNRFYLLVTPLLALVLPLLELPSLYQPEPLSTFVAQQFPPVSATKLTPTTLSPTPVHVAYPVADTPTFNFTFILLYGYFIGVGFCIFRLSKQLYHLTRFKQKTQADCFYWQNNLYPYTLISADKRLFYAKIL